MATESLPVSTLPRLAADLEVARPRRRWRLITLLTRLRCFMRENPIEIQKLEVADLRIVEGEIDSVVGLDLLAETLDLFMGDGHSPIITKYHAPVTASILVLEAAHPT